MSRFGWAYVNELVTGSVGTGPTNSVQFNSGSGYLSGSSDFIFDPATSNLTLLGLLSGSSLVISASAISASTYYGITGSGGSPGGSDKEIQFNSGSTFSGSSNLTFDYTTNILSGTTALFTTLSASHISASEIQYVNHLDFDTSSVETHQEGRLSWVDDTKTMSIGTDVNNVEIEVGHQSVVRVRNETGSPLNAGTIVYITGESGNRPLIQTASYESDLVSATTLGMVVAGINDSNNGYVVTNGIIRDIDTSLYSAGTQLYLSSSGNFSSTAPLSPLHEVRVGKVITQATSGTIYIDIMNGYEIGEIHDVLLSTLTQGDLLVYNSSSAVWENKRILSGSYTISGNLAVNGQVSASNSLLTNGPVSAVGNITSTNGILSSSNGVSTNSNVTAAGNITSTGGTISASSDINTDTKVYARNALITSGAISSSAGLSVGGSSTFRLNIIASASVSVSGNLNVTGSSNLGAVTSTGKIQANSFSGSGFEIYDIQGYRVDGVGPDWAIQYKDEATGKITGSNAIILSSSSPTINSFIYSNTGVVKSSRILTSSFTVNEGDYYLFVSGASITASLPPSITGREISFFNYGSTTINITSSGVSGIYLPNGTLASTVNLTLNPRALTMSYLSASNTWNIM